MRIVEDSIQIADNIVSLKVAVHRQGDALAVEPLVLDASPLGSVESFESHLDGAYFAMVVDGQVVHGDAWSLASLLTQVRIDIAAQEVLYIGQSFADGKSNASGRTAQHKTLQRIYEDHGGSAYDIFVSPLRLVDRSWSSDDHIDDAENGPDLQAFYEHFAAMKGPVKQRAVDLIEHALIAYFDPPYNRKLRHWKSGSPTKAMRTMREAGFRLLVVSLSGGNSLARFHSQLVVDTFRNHLICHDLPPEPSRPQLRGVSAESVSSWRSAAHVVRHGRQLFANLGEYAGIALRVFGDEAPQDRRPPEVALPDVAGANQCVSRALPQTRAADRVIRKKRRQIEEMRRWQSLPARPTYKNGTVKLGTRHSGEDVLWWLYDTTRRVHEHGFVLGDTESGDADAFLDLIAHEAARSRRFTVVPVHHSLADLVDVLDQRADNQARRKRRPSRRRPGLVAVIPDVEALVADGREAVALRRALSEGADRRMAVVMGLEDLDAVVERVGGLVVDVRNQHSLVSSGAAQVGSARAGLRARRATTQGDPDKVTFLLTWQSGHHTVSELVDTFNAELPFEQVKEAAARHVDETGHAVSWRQEAGVELWTALSAINLRSWILRRHDDAWALCRVIAQISGGKPGSRSQQLAWADEALLTNYEMPSMLSRWQLGPTLAVADGEALYCSVPRARLTPILRTTVNWHVGG
ncbi:MAG: hypothetical protein ACRDTS_01135 [Mycobacterium sp.]